jgi:hypothetical protein
MERKRERERRTEGFNMRRKVVVQEIIIIFISGGSTHRA